jgi:hypothetical protein
MSLISVPNNFTVPDDGVLRPIMALSKVVFPHPEVPRMTRISDGATVVEILSSTL